MTANLGVSVVIPTVGRSELRRAVESALGQSQPPKEVVIVADTANGLDLPSDSRVRVIRVGPGAGGNVARQTGIEAARGELIALLDDDDYWTPDKLERQLRRLPLDVGGDDWVLSCAVEVVGGHRAGMVWPKRSIRPDEDPASYITQRGWLRGTHGFIQASTLLFPRALALSVPFAASVKRHQDIAWLLAASRARQNLRIVQLPDALVKFAMTERSVSQTITWDDSLAWADLHLAGASPHAAADFAVTQPIYYARRAGSLRGALVAMRTAIQFGRPSPQCVIYGLVSIVWLAAFRTTAILSAHRQATHDGRIIFVTLKGQDDNIGDSMLRREYLSALRNYGPVHVLIDDAATGYNEGLGLQLNDFVYSRKSKWLLAMVRASGLAHVFVGLNAGAINGGFSDAFHMCRLALLGLFARLTGGGTIAMGLGFVDAAPSATYWRLVVRAFPRITWRDDASAKNTGHGRVAPDWAFMTGPDHPNTGERRHITVSVRGDRRGLPETLIDALKRAASERNCELVVAVQVGRDSSACAALSERLGAELIEWDDTSHAVQEGVLRGAYARSSLVLSDRLHVLIAALTEGSAVIALGGDDSDKAGRVLRAADVSIPRLSLTETEAISLDVLRAYLTTGPADYTSRLHDVRVRIRNAFAWVMR